MTDIDQAGAGGFVLRLEPELKARLRIDAARHGRSMHSHVASLIDDHTPPLEDEPATVAT